MSLRVGMRGSGGSPVAFGPEGSGTGPLSIAISTSGSISSVGSTEPMGSEEGGGIDGSWSDEEKFGSAMLRLAGPYGMPLRAIYIKDV